MIATWVVWERIALFCASILVGMLRGAGILSLTLRVTWWTWPFLGTVRRLVTMTVLVGLQSSFVAARTLWGPSGRFSSKLSIGESGRASKWV